MNLRHLVASVLLTAGIGSSSCQPQPPPVHGGATRKTNPRESTAFIQVRPPEQLRRLFQKVSTIPNLDPDVRDVFLGFASREVSGSGFAVASGSKGTRIVTNRHVVDEGEKVSISFDGGTSTTEGEIVYIDSDVDLAVIQIRSQIPTLDLLTEQPEDLQEVHALGFPGLAGHGSYQATRGEVSNNCLKEADFERGGSKRCFIQHTAPIDPGSSGGPLLMKQQVVGVNTLVIRGRQGVNLAIPSSEVVTVLKKTDDVLKRQKDADWMSKQLQRSCDRFMHEMSSGSPNLDRLVPLISNELILRKGLPALGMVQNPLVMEVFAKDPYTGMQLSLLLFLQEAIGALKGVASSEHCANINPSDEVTDPDKDVRITIDFRSGKHSEFSWRFDRGSWRLSDF